MKILNTIRIISCSALVSLSSCAEKTVSKLPAQIPDNFVRSEIAYFPRKLADTVYKFNHTIPWDCFEYVKPMGIIEKSSERLQKEKHVINVITNDLAAKNVNKEKVAEMIVDAHEETGIDLNALIAVAKQETHFAEKTKFDNGSGMMQVTSIVLKDMYQSPEKYDKEFGKILKNEFGDSLKNLFAKLDELKEKHTDNTFIFGFNNFNMNKNRNIVIPYEQSENFDELYKRIGHFGQILYDNKNSTELLNAIRKDSALNIRIGAYRLRRALNRFSDIRKAFENYNSGPSMQSYGESAYKHYLNSKKLQNELT